MISIIHPSRGRPQKAEDTADYWWDNIGAVSWEYILSCDRDDPKLNSYDSWEPGSSAKRIINDNRSAVDAVNNAAKVATGDILIVISDDTKCIPLWGKYLLEVVGNQTDWILKMNDGIQHWLITMPVMDRIYYNRFGYIYNPDYLHMFCDTELTCVADLTGRKLISNLSFPHNHYSVTKEPPDAISKRADGTWDQGEKLFLERYKRNFDLPPDQIKGKIEDNGMIRWLQKKVR